MLDAKIDVNLVKLDWPNFPDRKADGQTRISPAIRCSPIHLNRKGITRDETIIKLAQRATNL